jgi:lysozyme family protein
MRAPKFTPALAKEYSDFFNRCEIAADKMAEVEGVVQRILQFQNRYASIAAQSTVPWYVIAVIHNMECGLSFAKHLHNGDSLKRRTVNVPVGRPKTGQPPFTFEVSALDALEWDGLTEWRDWSIGGICYQLEGLNGWGYRKARCEGRHVQALGVEVRPCNHVRFNESRGLAQRMRVCLAFLNHRLCYAYFPENHPHPGKDKTRAEKRPDGKFLAADCPS